MIAWWPTVALAAHFAVVAPDGPIRPGKPTVLHVAAVDDLGLPTPAAPDITVSAGSATVDPTPLRLGIYAIHFIPPDAAGTVTVTAAAFGDQQAFPLIVAEPTLSHLKVPGKLEYSATDATIDVLVTGDDLPPPTALQVALSEGQVAGIDATPDGLLVHVTLPEGAAFARIIPIGVRDSRLDELPLWSELRLHTRTTIDLQTEPGVQLTLTVGHRSYGPFVADAQGVARPVIEQYPGELSANVVLTDDLGNETRTALSLTASASSSFAALASGAQVPGGAPPDVYLFGVHGDGHPWDGHVPMCRTPTADLSVHSVGPGAWRASLPDVDRPEDVRVRCTVGVAAETSVRVPVTGVVPKTIDLRIVPDELSTDFPVGEVRAVLYDLRGERMDKARGLVLGADTGTITPDTTPSGSTVRGEYDGTAAIQQGSDTVWARYDLPPGTGAPATLVVAYGLVSRSGEVIANVRVLDDQGLPLEGISVSARAIIADAPGTSAEGVTGADGWAAIPVRADAGLTPVVIEGRAGTRVARAVALRDARARGGPGSYDLRAERKVQLTTGRVNLVQVAVDPVVLITGSRAFAEIRVHIKDRAGAVVSKQPDEITVSEGTVGPWEPTPDGGWTANYTPGPGDQARSVDIVVRSGTATSQTVLTLEPRPIDRSAMFGFGLVSNFAAIFSPYLAADVDIRSSLFRGALMVRMGAAWYSASHDVNADPNLPARLRMRALPLNVGLLARGDYRGDALWGGLGLVVAPYSIEARYGDALPQRSLGVYPPGLEMLGGLGRRLGTGEAFVEARATALSAPGGDYAFTGSVGGVALLTGYRVIF